MLTRRTFLELGAFAGAGALLGCGAGRDPQIRAELPPPGTGLPGSLTQAARRELDDTLRVVSGAVPGDMLGHAFTIGALPPGGDAPLIAGDGIVYRLSFDPRGVRLLSRFVRTDCFLLDEATAGDEELGYRSTAFLRMSPAFGVRNFANTALQPIQDGRLLVTYDAGRPWEIDPVSLDVVTPVGLQSGWRPFLPGMSPGLDFTPLAMASAHPGYDPDDRVTYSVNMTPVVEGLSAEPFVRIVWWDGASEPKSCAIVDRAGDPAVLRMSCHQMNVTADHVVLVDSAFNIEAEALMGAPMATRPAIPETTLLIVHKDALVDAGEAPALSVTIPIEGAHTVTLRDDQDGVLRILVAHQNSFDPSEWIHPTDTVFGTGAPVDASRHGLLVQPADRMVVGRYEVDLETGELREARLFTDPDSWAFVLWGSDLRGGGPIGAYGDLFWATFGYEPDLLTERFMSAYADHPHRQVPVAELPTERRPAQLVRFSPDELAIKDRFVMPLGRSPLSPTFVPREGGAADEGYVVTFVASDDGDEIWIFDSEELAGGPLCRLDHPELDFAFTLHTTWMPELTAPGAPAYKVDRSVDYGERLAGLSPRAQELARRVLNI